MTRVSLVVGVLVPQEELISFSNYFGYLAEVNRNSALLNVEFGFSIE